MIYDENTINITKSITYKIGDKKTDNERNVRSFFSLSAFLNSLCQIFLQSISLIGFLPRKIYIGTSEMSVSSGLLVDRATQIQHFDDTGRSEIEVFAENLNQFLLGKFSGTEVSTLTEVGLATPIA